MKLYDARGGLRRRGRVTSPAGTMIYCQESGGGRGHNALVFRAI